MKKTKLITAVGIILILFQIVNYYLNKTNGLTVIITTIGTLLILISIQISRCKKK